MYRVVLHPHDEPERRCYVARLTPGSLDPKAYLTEDPIEAYLFRSELEALAFSSWRIYDAEIEEAQWRPSETAAAATPRVTTG